MPVEERKPEDKKPIRVLIDGEEHIAYWYDDCQAYKIGCGAPCHYCGGLAEVAFEPSRYATLAQFWMPLPEPPKGKR